MIRKFKKDDLPIITDIGNRAFQGIYNMFRELYGEELFNIMIPKPATCKGEQIENHCKNYPDWVYVCEEAGKIVGFITFIIDHDTKIATISDNAVDPQCGLKGIGQQMYKAVLDYFEQEGLLYARVTTGMDNLPARRAYERAGFSLRRGDVTYYKKL